MPNWAYIDYQIVGDNEQLDKLHDIIRELEERDTSLIENGFGKTWLGNLVVRLGGDINQIECRGSWYEVLRNEEGLAFSIEAAWREPQQFRHFLERQFPGIKIYFQSVGDDFWQTNDAEGRFFPQYYLYTEPTGEDYYMSLQELIAEVEDITGETGLCTLEDCEAAITRHSEVNDDYPFYLGSFDIVD